MSLRHDLLWGGCSLFSHLPLDIVGRVWLNMELELGFLTSAKEILTVDAEYRMMIPTRGSTGHQTYFAVGSCEGKRQI